MSFTVDEAYMKMALSLAQDGLGRVWPNPSVGCVLVKDGVPVGHGRTADGGRPHAEVEALTMAGDKAKGATAYVTLEPCNHDGKTPPCAQALIDAGVVRVVVACQDPDPRTAGRGLERLQLAGVDVELGLYEGEALDLNAGFFCRLKDNRPFVCLKQAISSNGMIASAAGQRTQISGAQAHEYLHFLRSSYDAIAVGVGTVIADNPMLTARVEGHTHSIVRVVFDSALNIPLDCKLVQSALHEPLWVIYKSADDARKDALKEAGVKLIESGACVQSAVQVLADEGITRLLVEGGAKLHNSFVEADLFDEVQFLKSDKSLPDDGYRAAFIDINDMTQTEKRNLGEDLLEIYRR